MAGENKPQVSENVSHYCQVHKLRHYLNGMSEDQKFCVRNMGMGFVFNLKIDELNPAVTNYYVQCDWDMNGVTTENGEYIEVRSFIKDLFDMPSNGKDLIHPGHHTYSKKPDNIEFANNEGFHYLVNMDISQLWFKVKQTEPGKDFCVLFMLALLNTLLAPSRDVKVDTSFLPDLVDHDKMKEKNWSKFVVDYLINGILTYKSKKGKRVPGCILILHFIHAVRVVNIPHGVPRSDQITSRHLKLAAEQVTMRKSADNSYEESMDSSTHSSHQSFRNKKARAGDLTANYEFIKAVISIKEPVTSELKGVLDKIRKDEVVGKDGEAHEVQVRDEVDGDHNLENEGEKVATENAGLGVEQALPVKPRSGNNCGREYRALLGCHNLPTPGKAEEERTRRRTRRGGAN